MLSRQQIDIVVDSLNKFQESYRSYDVCLLTVPQLKTIVGTSNYFLITKTLSVMPLSTVEVTMDWADPLSSECALEPYFCKLNPIILGAWRLMDDAVYAATNSRLLIVSAYRSPAYQLMILLKEVYTHDFDLEAARSLVASPIESEHQDPVHTALDFDIDDDQDIRYNWLVKHAAEYGFKLSYGKKNKRGMQFEPWHWRYIGL